MEGPNTLFCFQNSHRHAKVFLQNLWTIWARPPSPKVRQPCIRTKKTKLFHTHFPSAVCCHAAVCFSTQISNFPPMPYGSRPRRMCSQYGVSSSNQTHRITLLKTKRNLLYISNQSVPRCKHFPPRL